MSTLTITRATIHRYRDTGQVQSLVHWSDGSATTGAATWHNKRPVGVHMQQLFARAVREGVTPTYEEW